ncbi:MAG: glycosyltransferase [Candidatus Binatia bacterium]
MELDVLIVDDDSPDGTGGWPTGSPPRPPVASRSCTAPASAAWEAPTSRQFGRAFDDGAELVAQMDADLSHDPGALAAMVGAIADHDVVIGSRYMPGGAVDTGWNRLRKLISRGAPPTAPSSRSC